MTSVLALTGGSVTVATPGGPQTIDWADFFVGPLETSVHGPAVVTDAFSPRCPRAAGTAFEEVSRRKGDYAVCGAGVTVTLDEDSRVSSARAAYISVGLVPEVHDLTEAVAGRTVAEADWAAAGALARTLVDPTATCTPARTTAGCWSASSPNARSPAPPRRPHPDDRGLDRTGHHRDRQRCAT